MDFHWFTLRSNRVLVPLALIALAALFWVESGRSVRLSPWHDDMLRAARTAAEGAAVIKRHRLERGVFVDRVNDPAGTALIGQEYTQITTDRGYLEAKLASTDPNFAAVVVDMAYEIDVTAGDCVAVAVTGSFPALNLAALAALETIGAQPVLVTSVGASNYGATDPYFTWLDMERLVVEAGVLRTRSIAASLGGANDAGRGLAPLGRTLLREAADRNQVPLLTEERLEDSIRRRVEHYRQGCGEAGIAAYVNVGGGVASLGHSLNADLIPSGASLRLPLRNYPVRGALLRLAQEGVQVIQLLNIRSLRDRYGLRNVIDEVPAPGQGAVYGAMRYSMVRTATATGAILLLLLGLFVFDRRIHSLGQTEPEDDA